ncbi:MAG TPA: hypothetical protein VMI75_30775 [Polyangiaceae bacterium]|nr:hypothetical protein [Polyangiaceae bacterium]
MRAGLGSLVAAATVCAVVAWAPWARAQEPGDVAKAEQSFKQALADEQAGAWDKALGEFTRAGQLAHKQTPQLLYHLGVCNAKLGHLLAAREQLRAAADRAQQEGLENVMTQSKAQLADVQPRIAGITLTRPGQGTVAAVTVDGADATAKLGTQIDVDPGQHAVHVTYADAAPQDVSVKLAEGERRDLVIPTPASAAAGPTTAPTRDVPTPTGSGSPEAPAVQSGGSTRTIGWVLVGGGAALVTGGVVMWILRGNEISTLNGECHPTAQDCPTSAQGDISNGKLYDALGITGFVAGGAAALAGAGLLVFGGSHGDGATGFTVGPMLAHGGGGLRVTGALW